MDALLLMLRPSADVNHLHQPFYLAGFTGAVRHLVNVPFDLRSRPVVQCTKEKEKKKKERSVFRRNARVCLKMSRTRQQWKLRRHQLYFPSFSF